MGMSYHFHIGPFVKYEPPKREHEEFEYLCSNSKCVNYNLKKFKEDGFCPKCGIVLAQITNKWMEDFDYMDLVNTFDDSTADRWMDCLNRTGEMHTNILWDNYPEVGNIHLDGSYSFPENGFITMNPDREIAIEKFKKKYANIFETMEKEGFKLTFDYGVVINYS